MADVNQTTEQTVQPTGVKVEPAELRLQVGDEELVLVSVEPPEAEQKVSSGADPEFVLVTALGANDAGQLQFRLKAVKEGDSTVTFKSTADNSLQATASVVAEVSESSSSAEGESTDQAAPAAVVDPQAGEDANGTDDASPAGETPSQEEAFAGEATDTVSATDSNPESGAAPAVDGAASTEESAPAASDDTAADAPQQPADDSAAAVEENDNEQAAPANPAGGDTQAPSTQSEGSGTPAGTVDGEPVETPTQEEPEPAVEPAPEGDGTVDGEEPVYVPQPPEAEDPLEPEVDPEEQPEPTGDGTVNGEEPVYLPNPHDAVPAGDGPANARGEGFFAPQEGGDTNPPVPEKFSPISDEEERVEGDGTVNGEKPEPFVQDAFEYKPYATDLSVDNPLPPAQPKPAYPHDDYEPETPYYDREHGSERPDPEKK